MQDSIRSLIGDLDAAIHETVTGYVDPVTRGRGATALAPRLNIAAGTLANKANPLQDHQLTVHECVALQLATANVTILHAEARALGHVAIQLPHADDVGDLALLDAYCEVHAKVGHMSREIRLAFADKRISDTELRAIRVAFDALIRSGLGLVNRIEGLVR